MPKQLIFIILLLISFLITACDDPGQMFEPVYPDTYEVDPVFREFYDRFGGLQTLGPAISELFIVGEVRYQYTVAALLVYDPLAPESLRRQFASLGLDLDMAEPPVAEPTQPGIRYVDGHIIPDFFVPMYEAMGGARYMGKPLTEAHYNPEKRRYTQYFENLGLYWIEDAPLEEVGMLALGAWRCDNSCRQPPLGDGIVLLPFRVAARFVDTVARLGISFTGYASTEAYQTPDGYIEQVFENIVLVEDPNKPGRVFLRAITERLGTRPDPPVPDNGLPGYQFYPTQGELGYNVAQTYLDYFAQHGGPEIAGPPISERVLQDDHVYRQCFRNLCLEERQNSDGSISIQPAQLGYIYKRMSVAPVQEAQQPVDETYPTSSPAAQQALPSSGETAVVPTMQVEPGAQTDAAVMPAMPISEISLQVWENSSVIAPDQTQEIGVVVYENNQPVQNVEPDLLLTYPDGSKKTFYMMPTGSDGQTRIQIPPLAALNGSIIPYQVCIFNLASSSKYCVRESYMIWQNP
jgi:hypothetical protein